MSRTIKLRESDIARIVRKVIREEEKKEGKKKEPTSIKDLDKLNKSQFKKLMKKMGMDKSIEGLKKGYSKMYKQAPNWVKSQSLTPDQLSKRIADIPPDEDPQPAAYLILAIFCWTIAAWSFATFLGWEHSDLRLKENISRTGVSESGIPIYTFNYKNDNQLWSGTMAQDLLSLGREDVVKVMDNGYYAVNYDMIDVDMISKN
jgi:hypothetical protein